jgi:hypothetical protein
MSFKKLMGVFLILFIVAGGSEVNAACGGSYQRMQVGILPDVFLNHELIATRAVYIPSDNWFDLIMYPFRWIWLQVEVFFQLPITVSEKTFNHYWTGNLSIPGVGDCNILSFVTLQGVGVAQTYSPCTTNLSFCDIKWYPESAAVGPAIAENTVKEWPIRILADADLSSEKIGGVLLFGLDCAGDICIPPPCLQQNIDDEYNEFDERIEGPDRSCLNFNLNGDGWVSNGPGVGDAYLVGRGNLYIGSLDQPAFQVEASTSTARLQIDHWIVNENPRAVILVTPKVSEDQPDMVGFFGVNYDAETRRWSIIAESENTRIAAGSQFNVYVMGDKGPGFKVRGFAVDRIWLDDPLLNENPNAMIFATHVIDEACTERVDTGRTEIGGFSLYPGERPAGGWICNMGYFPHPVGVNYDSVRKKWALISQDGTNFPSPVVYNIVVAGLAGSYRSADWYRDDIPTYAGKLEQSHAPVTTGAQRMALPQLNAADENSIVFVMQNESLYDSDLTGRRNSHPVGVLYQDGQWYVHNLDNQPMATAAGYNVFIPLLAP